MQQENTRSKRGQQAVQLHTVAAQSMAPTFPLSQESPQMQAAGLGRQGQGLGNSQPGPHTLQMPP